MRSLGTIRARVDRLAAAWPRAGDGVRLVGVAVRAVPRVRLRFGGSREGGSVGEAVAGRDPRDLPPPVVFFSTDELTTCPRCGAPLPSAAPVS